MMRNTNVHTLKADSFATADCKFELKNLAGTAAGFAANGNLVGDDTASECDEGLVLIRMADGTIKYRARNTVDPSGINGQSVYNGTAAVDRMYGGNDSDTFWGGLGNDVIEGGDGADVTLGGEGNDIMTDLAGDDVPKGGPGNDAIDAGPGLDIIMGGEGKDFTNGGANANETFGGAGDDFMILGQSLDAAFGDSGDDWEEGGDQPDLMQGDSGNLFFLDDSQKPGSDILIGQGGDDDYDMEGGDDIGLDGPGIEKVAGASGYDWEIGLGNPQAEDLDLALPFPALGILEVGVRDKFNEVEALSGAHLNDILRGDDVVPSAVGGGGFIGCDVLDQAGLDRINGLDALVPALATPLASVIALSASSDCPILSGANVWGDGNILLGGGGSDLIEGRGADDIIDGDRYLSVRLSVRTDASNPATEIGSAGVEGSGQSAMTSRYLRNGAGALIGQTLQEAVFAGVVDPGNIVAVREILVGSGGTDTAVFSGLTSDYTVTTTGGALGSAGSVTTVVDNVGGDGIDTLRNVERLRFLDTAIPVAPGVPTIGAAVAGNTQATVSFTASATGVADSFSVKVLNGAGVQVGALRTAAAGATSLIVTGLTNGTAVTFQVSATNAEGTSAFSASSNAVTPILPLTVAGAPTIGTPTPGNASATVNWTAPASNGGSAITGYTVRAFAGATLARTQTVTGNVGTVVVTGLTNGTAYTFDVAAVNAVGTGGFSARSIAVTPRTEFVAPTVIARTPATGARSVSQTGNLTATFSEAVTGVNGTTFVLQNGATTIAAVVTYNATTRVATLNPNATLAADQTFTATLSGIRDVAGNTMTPSSWTFTTGPAPTITNTTPRAGATGVRRNSDVNARFSETITGFSASTVQVTRVSNGAVVPSAIGFNTGSRVLTINPTGSLLANTQYRVTITGGTGAVRDLAGNPVVTTTWLFRTGNAL